MQCLKREAPEGMMVGDVAVCAGNSSPLCSDPEMFVNPVACAPNSARNRVENVITGNV